MQNTSLVQLVATSCMFKGMDYLILVDRCSGYILCKRIARQSTPEVVRIMSNVAEVYGRSKLIMSDFDPAFHLSFTKFCNEIGA